MSFKKKERNMKQEGEADKKNINLNTYMGKDRIFLCGESY